MKHAIRFLKKSDPTLRKIIEASECCTLAPAASFTPYRSLIRAITYQQLHGKAAETIFKRFLALYPHSKFPSPEEIIKTPMKKLRSAGLSEAKALSIRDVAQKTVAKVVPSSRTIRKLPDQEIIDRLTQIRGVGIWTVQMMLMFQLGRMDVFPVDDYGVRNGFSLAYKRAMPRPKELLAFGEKWKPYRSVAAWYLWRAVDLQKAQKKLAKEAQQKKAVRKKR